jgi:hypothetical protein
MSSDPVIEGTIDALVRLFGCDRETLEQIFTGVVAQGEGGAKPALPKPTENDAA